MPMGIVSDSDFDQELNRLKKDDVTVDNAIAEIRDIERGRGNGNKEVPNTLRKVIGEESAINGRASALDLARNFGISPSSVSAYDVGAKSTASYDQRPNQSHIIKSRERIATRARAKLTQAILQITKDKLVGSKAKDLASIAKDMSAVIRNMEPEPERKGGEGVRGPTFVFYCPQFRSESSFEIVRTGE